MKIPPLDCSQKLFGADGTDDFGECKRHRGLYG